MLEHIQYTYKLFTSLDLFLSDLVNENSSVSILKRQNTKTFYEVFRKRIKYVLFFYYHIIFLTTRLTTRLFLTCKLNNII